MIHFPRMSSHRIDNNILQFVHCKKNSRFVSLKSLNALNSLKPHHPGGPLSFTVDDAEGCSQESFPSSKRNKSVKKSLFAWSPKAPCSFAKEKVSLLAVKASLRLLYPSVNKHDPTFLLSYIPRGARTLRYSVDTEPSCMATPRGISATSAAEAARPVCGHERIRHHRGG